jgi:hypothetical protein
VTIREVCQTALLETGVIAAGETMGADAGTVVLGKLRRIFNNFNAERRAVYATAFVTNTLTPSLSPHTIGPTGATWTVTQRPVSVDGASLILPGSGGAPDVNLPIVMRDSVWWNARTVPALETSVPTDLYYQPDWPNGKLFFWPVPTTAYDVQLMIRVVLDDAVVLNDTFSLPPGYQDAITRTLEESICDDGSYGVPESVMVRIKAAAKLAKARIFSNNEEPTRIQTADAGMQTSNRLRPTYNYLSGNWISGR